MRAAWWAVAGCLVALALAAVPTAGAATVRLDTTFGDGGIARVTFRVADGRTLVRPLRPVRQPDGKVLMAAAIEGDRAHPMQVALARFKRTGQLDPTFGRDGRVRLGAAWNFDPRAVEVQPDGRILLMGAAGRGINSMYPFVAPGQLGLVRLLQDGSRDRTFGTNGFVAWNPAWRSDTRFLQAIPGALLRQADGRLLVALSVDELRAHASGNASVWRFAFARFNPNGSMDESFGRSGVIEGPDGPDYFWLWATLPNGDLVALTSRNVTVSLGRFNPDGTLDREFGHDGFVPVGLDLPIGVIEPVPARDGSVVLISHQHGDTALRRILPAGHVDAEFGTACRLPLRAFPWGGAAATADGGLLVTGTTYVMRGRQHSVFVRYDARGCVAGGPLRVRAVSAGPPLLHGRRRALIGATYDRGLALVRIRR